MPKPLTVDRFLQRAHEVHGSEKYDYSNVQSVDGVRSKIDIRCCRCNLIFHQQIHAHYRGQGCPFCADASPKTHELRQANFFERANRIHGERYDYSRVEYVDVSTKIRIGCNKCGHSFEQLPGNHVYVNNSGCPRCVGRVSKREVAWLDSLNVPIECRQKRLPGTQWNVDALVERTVYEFYGRYYHGDPRDGAPNKYNTRSKKTYRELYDVTIKRHHAIEILGYVIVYVWEVDWIAGEMFSKQHPERWID